MNPSLGSASGLPSQLLPLLVILNSAAVALVTGSAESGENTLSRLSAFLEVDNRKSNRRHGIIWNDYKPYIRCKMGILKISEQMHENLRSTSTALSRSINAQAEHWLRVGMLAELNPNLSYGEICQLLIRAHQSEALGPAVVQPFAKPEAA